MTSEHWTQKIGNLETCPVCGTKVSEQFCTSCGQKILEHRLKFGEVVSDLFARIFNHERGLFFTFWCLLIRPGQLIRDYVSGKQKIYVSPLTVFFIGATLQLLSIWLHGDRMRQIMLDEFATGRQESPAQFERMDRVFGGQSDEILATAYLDSLQQGYTYVALFAFCLPWAFLLYGFQSSGGIRFRLAETAVFSLYTFGTVLALTAVMGLLTLPLAWTWHFPLSMAIYGLYPQWAHTHFFRSGFRARLTTLLTTAASAAVFVTAIIGVFILSVLFRAAF